MRIGLENAAQINRSMNPTNLGGRPRDTAPPLVLDPNTYTLNPRPYNLNPKTLNPLNLLNLGGRARETAPPLVQQLLAIGLLYICIYIHMYIYIYIHTYIHIIYTYKYIHTYIHTYIRMHMYVRVCVCVGVCVCVCVFVCVCVYSASTDRAAPCSWTPAQTLTLTNPIPPCHPTDSTWHFIFCIFRVYGKGFMV